MALQFMDDEIKKWPPAEHNCDPTRLTYPPGIEIVKLFFGAEKKSLTKKPGKEIYLQIFER